LPPAMFGRSAKITPKMKIGVFDQLSLIPRPVDALRLIKEFKIEALEIGSNNDPGHGLENLDGQLLLTIPSAALRCVVRKDRPHGQRI
jgi:hypothetical protein